MRKPNPRRLTGYWQVKVLYPLGLAIREIERCARLNHVTISKVFHLLGGAKAFPHRATDREEVYTNVLSFYASIADTRHKGISHQDGVLITTLDAWLRVSELIASVKTARAMVKCLTVPGYTVPQAGHVRLLRVLLDAPKPACYGESPQISHERTLKIWAEFLHAIVDGAIEPPCSHDATIAWFAMKALRDNEHAILPSWQHHAVTIVNNALLSQLSVNEREFIRRRYGIGKDQPWPLKELKKHYRCSSQAIYQRQIRIERKLKAWIESRDIKLLALPVESMIDAMLKLAVAKRVQRRRRRVTPQK